ncbi:MAG: NAD(P)H-dependent glycerol-3-phosphate dehydrogenase [Bacteroidales bacterium]|nr:NAD(P)H-dependent glycerol-3-phosphate dehydrogenase [Bacteroidales bacterium]
MQQRKIAVLGGGSWATALVKILLETQSEVAWFMRNSDRIKHIQKYHHNPQYLSSVELDVSRLRLSDNIKEVVDESDILILAIPAVFLEDAMNPVRSILEKKIIVSAVKGIIPEKNLIIGEFFNQYYNVPLESIAVISGPSHAEEVALERLSYLTFASMNAALSEDLCSYFDCHYINSIPSDDIYGTEYSAVLKNIMALAAGIYHGLGYGDNFQAVLISNAIQEIKRFVDKVHPITRDIKSSAYLGDLLVTAYSQFSRNRLLGTMVGKGYSVKAAHLEMNMIAEGYFAAKCIHESNKEHKVIMPIAEAVYRILYEGISPMVEMQLLTKFMK